MKKVLLYTALALAAVTAVAFAEPFDNIRVHFAQPVRVASADLPAGDYSIEPVEMNTSQQFLAFRSTSHSVLVPVRRITPNPGETHRQTTLVLLPDNGGLRLAKIWLEDGSTGYEVVAESR